MVYPARVMEAVEITKYGCAVCGKVYTDRNEAIACEEKCEAQREAARNKYENEMRKRDALFQRAYDEMPKLSEEEYAKLAVELAISCAPDIIPCIGCGHPKLKGYECMNFECKGEPKYIENSDVDVEGYLEDDCFDLPSDFKIVFGD